MATQLMQLARNKKGIGNLVGVCISLLILVVIAGVAGTVLEKLQATQTVNGTAYNVTQKGLNAFSDFSGYFGLIVLVVIASTLVGLLLAGFVGKGRRGA